MGRRSTQRAGQNYRSRIKADRRRRPVPIPLVVNGVDTRMTVNSQRFVAPAEPVSARNASG